MMKSIRHQVDIRLVPLRTVDAVIEFKQIIRRGARLYDDKDDFTIDDFVRAHHHFNDLAWDGERADAEPPKEPRPPNQVREVRGSGPPDALTLPNKRPHPDKLQVQLADGKARLIQSMNATTF